MTAVVRPATASDVPAMVALINAIIARGGTTAHQVPYDDARFKAAYLAGPEAISTLVATTPAGRITGFQVLGFWPGLPGNWGDIGTFVDPAARRTGAGAALFAETCKVARDRNLVALNATIRADNSQGLGFYNRLGFVDYAHDPDWCLDDGTRVGRVSKRYDF